MYDLRGLVPVGISNNPILSAFKGLFLFSHKTTVSLRLGGPQPALGMPSANLIGCSFVPKSNNGTPGETAKTQWFPDFPQLSVVTEHGEYKDGAVPTKMAA